MAFSRDPTVDPRAMNDRKSLNAVRIHVYEAEKPGPVRQGFAHVIFGPEKKPAASTKYEVNLANRKEKGRGTITLAVAGHTATAGFEGRTGQGVGMHITMHCTDLMDF